MTRECVKCGEETDCLPFEEGWVCMECKLKDYEEEFRSQLIKQQKDTKPSEEVMELWREISFNHQVALDAWERLSFEQQAKLEKMGLGKPELRLKTKPSLPTTEADARPSDDDLKECEHEFYPPNWFNEDNGYPQCKKCGKSGLSLLPKPKEKSNKATAQELPKIKKLDEEQFLSMSINERTLVLGGKIRQIINNLNSR